MDPTSDKAFMEAVGAFDVRAEAVGREDLCTVYKKIKPILTGILPFIRLIPVWGAKAASAIEVLLRVLGSVCPNV